MTQRLMILKCLDKLGHKACYAIDGLHALNSIEGMRAKGLFYHIIFLDVNMPRLTGFELLKLLADNKDFDFSKTKIIMVTTETTKEFIKIARDYGVYAWMVKPISESKIEDLIAKVQNETD